MARARTQRILAAAGLSVVTGTAAIGLAIVGVGPLGQVAASVRDTGVAVSRGVLSVVMPDDDPPPATDADGGDSSAAPAPRRDRDVAEGSDRGPAQGAATSPDSPSGDEPAGPSLPDTVAAAGKPEPSSVLEAMAEAFGGAPSAEAAAGSSTQDQPEGLVEGLLSGVLGQTGNLTAGALR